MGLFKKDKTKELSERWIKEGQQFKDQLTAFVDAIYSGGEGPEEPYETREDMAGEVYKIALDLNEKGEHKKLRELFPPAFEPFVPYYDNISRCVNQVIVLKDGRIVARADGNVYLDDGSVFVLEEDKATEQEGIMAVGISANKEYVVKITDKAIQVHKEWDDDPIWTGKYPKGYGKATENISVSDFEQDGLIVLSADVFNDGKRVLLATTNGIFIVSENEDSQCVFPTQDMIPDFIEEFYNEYEESVPFEISLDYFHAKLSPDNTKIATGFQMSEHCILEADGNDFKVTGAIQARSEYPHTVSFHDTLNHVALASCHYQQSAVIGMDLSHLPLQANASWYQEESDSRFDILHDNAWAFSIVPYKEGYLLGINNGYIFYRNPKNPKEVSYIHLGGTIMSMDFSADKKYLVVGTYSGYVVKIDLTASERDKTLITDMNVKETNRWVLWGQKGTEALIW